MSRKDDKPKNHSYGVINIEDNLAISVLSLILTVTLALPFVVWMLLDQGTLPGGLLGFLIGLTAYFAGFILALFTTVTSLIGFLLGHSSIKGFQAKGKRTWAIIVTLANFITLIGSVIGVIYFSSIFR